MKFRAGLPVIVAALAAGLLMAGCGDNPSAGTDAGNADKVAGILTDASGLAVAGRLVQMRSADFQGSLADSLTKRPTPGKEWSDTTGPDGSFAFFPAAADTGDFVVEALVDEVKGARTAFRREPNGSVQLGALVLKAIGGITGKVSLPLSGFGGVVVTLLGTHQSQYFPPGSSPTGTNDFGFYALPPGRYMVRVEGILPVREAVDTLIEVPPGKTVADLSLTAGEIRYKIKALIVDGIANHDWKRMTLYHSAILKGTGLFEVTVSTTPPDKSGPAAWAAWNPRFADFDVVILHCNSGYGDIDSANPWPDSIRKSLETFVSAGGGLVNTHATFPFFAGWPAFEDMHGLKWKFAPGGGPNYRVDTLGGLIADTAALDSGSMEFTSPGNAGEKMGTANPTHPINNGLPARWLLPASDLVYRLKGNPQGITVVQYSINPGTGNREPQLWTKPFGNGRVFTDAVGHLQPGMPNTLYRCAGYQTTFSRGVEWAATGKVTLPVPGDFPGPDSLSLRSNLPD